MAHKSALRRTMLGQIQNALAGNDQIKVWPPIFQGRQDGIIETAEIVIAPLNPIIVPEQLNRLQRDLVPGLLPKFSHPFLFHTEGGDKERKLILGIRWNDEPLALQTTGIARLIQPVGSAQIILRDPAYSNNQQQIATAEHVSYRTLIRLFPHPCFAQAHLDARVNYDRQGIPEQELCCSCAAVAEQAATAVA